MVLTALALLAAACGVSGSSATLSDAHPTREAVAAAVLDAIWQRDEARLDAIAISESEFRAVVWPSLPASRPEVGMPFEYLWADSSTKSRAYRAQLLERWGGRRLQLEGVAFGGATTDYRSFRVHAATRVLVRDDAGNRRELRLFGSMIETSDGWKVYSYVVD